MAAPAKCYVHFLCLDGDTIFCFNYRSDRMREIVSVLGLPDKPMEVSIPNDLVSFMVNNPSLILLNTKYRIFQLCQHTTLSILLPWHSLLSP